MLLKVIVFSIVCLLAFQNEVSARGRAKWRAFPVILTPNISTIVDVNINSNVFGGESFDVYFEEERDLKPDGDIGLYVLVKYSKSENELALNNRVNGEWGEEETHEGLPDRQGSYSLVDYLGYRMQIITRDDDFLIKLNGKEYTFKYRFPKEDLGKFRFVVISGDASLQGVEFERVK